MEKNKYGLHGQNRKGIPELRVAFDSAKTIQEKLKIFRKIEARLQEKQLGGDCFKMAAHLLNHDQDPLMILSIGKRALNITLKNEDDASDLAMGSHASSFVISGVLHLLGSACLKLGRLNESLSYLNWSDRNLSKLLLDNYYQSMVFELLRNTQRELYFVKKAMGKGSEDAILHLRKVLEIVEKIREKGCLELAKANQDVSDAYLDIYNDKEALPFALKALEIYQKLSLRDDDTVERVAKLRLCLATIYTGFGEHDKALEHYRFAIGGLKSTGKNARLLLEVEAEGGQTLVALGRFEEAIETLKPVISQPENVENRKARGMAYMFIAKAFCGLQKYADAKKYINKFLRIIEKKGFDVVARVSGLMSMSNLFQVMNEYEMAISLLQKALNRPELPQQQLADCSLRLSKLVSFRGMENSGRISYLEEVVERLKETFGPKHSHVGCVYTKLGKVYVNSGRPEMAIGCFVSAKDIFDVSTGPNSMPSLGASQTLSAVYESMKSYDLANEIQQQVLEGLKGLGISEQEEVDKAVEMLNMIK